MSSTSRYVTPPLAPVSVPVTLAGMDVIAAVRLPDRPSAFPSRIIAVCREQADRDAGSAHVTAVPAFAVITAWPSDPSDPSASLWRTARNELRNLAFWQAMEEFGSRAAVEFANGFC